MGYRRNRKNTIVFESRVFGRTDESVPTGLSSLTSGSFCLVSFSDSLTSCFRNPPGTTDRGGGGVGVTSGAFSSFICGHQGEHKDENLNPSGGKRTISSSFIHSNHSCYCCCPSGWMRALIGVLRGSLDACMYRIKTEEKVPLLVTATAFTEPRALRPQAPSRAENKLCQLFKMSDN